MMLGCQVNSHLGWVILFCFSQCGFGSSGTGARDALFWSWVCPGLAQSVLLPRVLSELLIFHTETEEKQNKRKISPDSFCRKTSALFYGVRRGTVNVVALKWEMKVGSTSSHVKIHCSGYLSLIADSRGRQHFNGTARSLPRAPSHRHYPNPHCCAIPALKRLCTVPVRLAWHYHTITHSFDPLCHTHECSAVEI